MKNIILILLFSLASSLSAQERLWASYYGPESNLLFNLQEDAEGNLYGNMDILEGPNVTADYMNSFVTEGAFYSYNPSIINSSMFFKLSPQGDVLWSSFFPGEIYNFKVSSEGEIYILAGNSAGGEEDVIDLIMDSNSAFPDPYEFGDDEERTKLNHYLVKFDTDGQKLWGTFLPVFTYLAIGRNGDIYISGIYVVPEI